MTRNHKLELVTHAADSLQKAREAAQASDAHVANAQQALAALLALYEPGGPPPATVPCIRTVIANGRRLTDDEARTVDEDNYDVILDMTAVTLKYREDPKTRSKLKLATLQGIGPYRIRLLAFMMEHPSTALCADNVDQLREDTMRSATQQAFTRSIYVLRQALGGGGQRNCYIHSVAAWESSRSYNARAYQLKSEWKYLLIKHGKFGKS